MSNPINTDAMDTIRLNKLRKDAASELARALWTALGCGAVGLDQANRIAAILMEGK